MRRLRPICALVTALALLAVACSDDGVTIRFRPAAGDVFHYEVHVHSVTDTVLDGQPPDHTDEDVRLVAEHTVTEVDDGGAVVRVKVGQEGAPPESFIVRLDRRGRVAEVRPERDPTTASLGLAEVFPAAAGGPPSGALHPGDRWTIDETVSVPGATGVRLRGHGTLEAVDAEDGRTLARVSSTSSLPLRTSTHAPQGEVRLTGRQRVEQDAVYDLDDGAILRVESVSVGRFDVRVVPPSGDEAMAVTGTSRVRVVSTTVRL